MGSPLSGRSHVLDCLRGLSLAWMVMSCVRRCCLIIFIHLINPTRRVVRI